MTVLLIYWYPNLKPIVIWKQLMSFPHTILISQCTQQPVYNTTTLILREKMFFRFTHVFETGLVLFHIYLLKIKLFDDIMLMCQTKLGGSYSYKLVVLPL